jgi:major membrane immunogen (membrane-anchored lipoprotein)
VKNRIERLSLLTLAFLLGSVVAFGQGTPDVSGTYEGTVKKPDASESKISIELKTESGKITGRAIHGEKSMAVTDAKLENGVLTLNFGSDHKFVGKLDGDQLVGDAFDGPAKFPLSLKKRAATGTPAATSAAPAAAFNLNGDWEAVADANGQPFPFSLTLKVDGETVTGGSSSQLGDSTIKSGTWKDGKLAFQLDGQNGVVTMSAVVIDGKLSGEFDFSGQMQGKWVAVKKN